MEHASRIDGKILVGREQTLSNQVTLYCRGQLHPGIDTVALEAPLAVFLNGRQAAHTMRTPGADRDLALGLLLTSGHIPGSVDAGAIEFHEADAVIRLRCPVAGRFPLPQPGIRPDLKPPLAELAEQLLNMRVMLEERQRLHRHTGATHGAMFFDRGCEPLSFSEDVGRHNAFDKCVGSAVRRGVLENAHHAVVTSRLSHEIVNKAVRAGVRVLAGFSVATSIAVDMARGHGMVLVGKLRDETLIIYG